MGDVSLINGHIDEPITCNDCLHNEICLEQYKGLNQEMMFRECKRFKAKKDLVEVVRCKDCKYWANRAGWEDIYEDTKRCDHPSFDSDGYCYDFWLNVKPDDFCSYGERRGKEE